MCGRLYPSAELRQLNWGEAMLGIQDLLNYGIVGYIGIAIIAACVLAGAYLLVILVEAIIDAEKRDKRENQILDLWRADLKNHNQILNVEEILQFDEIISKVVEGKIFYISFDSENDEFNVAIDNFLVRGVYDHLDLFGKTIGKLVSDPSLAAKMSDQDCALVNQLFREFHSETKKCVDLIELYEARYERYTETEAFAKVVPDLVSSIKTISINTAQSVQSLAALYDELVVRVVTGTSIPEPVKVNQTEPIINKVAAAVGKCKSVLVKKRFSALKPRLDAYLCSKDASQDLERRVNAYYLPTLVLTLESLITAEKKKSKQVKELEMLCLRSIETIEGILTSHEAGVDESVVRTVQVEVEAMERLAAVKGDIST